MVLYQRAKDLYRRYGQQTIKGINTGMQAYKYGRKLVKGAKLVKDLSRSRTTTKRRRKRSKQNWQNSGDGASHHFKKIQYRQTKLGKFASFVGGELIYQNESTGTISWLTTDLVNTQKVARVGYLFSGPDGKVLFEQLEKQNAGAPLAGATDLVSSVKFYIHGVTNELRVVNQNKAPSVVTIYYLLAKKTVQDATGSHPDVTWDVGNAYKQIGADTEPHSLIGAVPTTSKLFNMDWKIVNKHKISMQPGGSHTSTFTFNPRSVVDKAYFTEHDQIRGLTVHIMMVAHGTLGQTVGLQVVPEPPVIIYSSKQTYKVKTVNSYENQIFTQRSNPTLTVAGAGTISVVADDGSVI